MIIFVGLIFWTLNIVKKVLCNNKINTIKLPDYTHKMIFKDMFEQLTAATQRPIVFRSS